MAETRSRKEVAALSNELSHSNCSYAQAYKQVFHHRRNSRGSRRLLSFDKTILPLDVCKVHNVEKDEGSTF